MFTIPPAIIETIQDFDFGKIDTILEEYSPTIQSIKETWTIETIRELLDGKVPVPDTLINKSLEEHMKENSKVKEIKIASHANGTVQLTADTEGIGKIEISGKIEKFIHNKDESIVSFRVKERALKDHGLMSWFVSRMSLSMAEKLFGKIEISDTLPLKIDGNIVTVDVHNLVETSSFAQNSISGYRLIDMVEIEEAVPHEGYIAFKTKLNVPDDVKDKIGSILNLGKGENEK